MSAPSETGPSPSGLFCRWGISLLCLLGLSLNLSATPFQPALTDAAISNVLYVVGNHQLKTIADPTGGYAPAYTLAAAQSSTNRPTGVTWEYGWAVTLYGLLQVKTAIGTQNLENFVLNHNLILARYYNWLKSLETSVTNATLSQIQGVQNSSIYDPVLYQYFTVDRLDYCGSATASVLEGAMFHTTGFTNDTAFMARNTDNWVSRTQSRLPDSTLWRPERNNTIWADDLYMGCNFLLRYYQFTGNTNYLEDVVRQVTNFAGYLQDTNGVFYHGYYYGSNTVSGIKWGRANGWAIITQVELLSVLPANHPSRTNLLGILTRHIEGLKPMQAPTGMWRQVLDDTNVWEETSCTAMFSYAIARAANRGWIDPTNLDVARRAFAAVSTNVSTTGVISNICVGTSIDPTEAYYIARTRANDDHRGVGAVMLAGAEILLRPQLSYTATTNQLNFSWNVGSSNLALQTCTAFNNWTNFTGPTNVSGRLRTATANPGETRFYRLQPQPRSPLGALVYEAESCLIGTNGASASTVTDTNASGGLYVLLNSTNANGNTFTFGLQDVPQGTYRLRLAFKGDANRGIAICDVAGTTIGNPLNEYWPSAFYPIADLGLITSDKLGSYAVRLTVTGKSIPASGYTATADAFILIPQ